MGRFLLTASIQVGNQPGPPCGFSTPDHELLAAIVSSATASFDTSSQSSDSNSQTVNVDLQTSNANGAEYFSKSVTTTGNSNHNFGFSASVSLSAGDFTETEGETELADAISTTEGEGETAPESTTTIAPDFSLEMSLSNSSTRTEVVNYSNINTIEPLEDGWGDRGTHAITYTSKPISTTSYSGGLSFNEDDELILSVSTTETTGFEMQGSDVQNIEHPYVPDSNSFSPELYRTELITHTTEEKRNETNTTTVSINLSQLASADEEIASDSETQESGQAETSEGAQDLGQSDAVTIETTRRVSASGSDSTISDTTWHVWEQQEDGGDPENGGGGISTVFLYDLKAHTENSLTYNYSNTPEDGRSGTRVETQIEDFDRVDDYGNIIPTLVSTVVTTDLLTGISTTVTESNLPGADQSETTEVVDAQENALIEESYFHWFRRNLTQGLAANSNTNMTPIDLANVSIGWIADDAKSFAEEYGESSDEVEALRHGYWSAMMTVVYGETNANAIGDAHELLQLDLPDSHRDLENNIIGRSIGVQVLLELSKGPQTLKQQLFSEGTRSISTPFGYLMPLGERERAAELIRTLCLEALEQERFSELP